MSQLIQIRRGTKAELLNYGSLENGELGFCTDTREVYVGDGNMNHLVGGTMQGTLANRPGPSTRGRLYYVTSGDSAGYLFYDDGANWHSVNALKIGDLFGTLDDITDGTLYKKVTAADVTGGHVNKVSDGTNTTTADEVRKHIDNVEIHRKINDASIGSTDLWSSQKIKSEIFNAIKGLDWQDSVKSAAITIPPVSPALHDRYLVPQNASGAWANKTGQIADWNGTTWDFYTPNTGWAVYVEAENKNYTYNISGVWVVTGGANQTLEAGKGLTGGGSSDIITLDVGAGNGVEVSADAVSVKAYNGITVDANGVAANIDNVSIQFDSADGNKLTVVRIDGGTF